MDPKAQEILEIIRQGRECNIKTLNTIDTKTLTTIKTKNQHTFAQGSVMSDGTSFPSSGQASDSLSQGALEENDSSQVVARASEITYLSASLKSEKTSRRTLNIDFRMSTTPVGKFNKLVFSLSDRRREFLANVPAQYHNDWEYQSALEYYYSSTYTDIWIGKGRPRGKFTQGRHLNSKIQLGLAAVLEKNSKGYIANVWLDGHHKQFELSAVNNSTYPFRYDSGSAFETMEVLPRGGWL
jgi:hypothetical protein